MVDTRFMFVSVLEEEFYDIMLDLVVTHLFSIQIFLNGRSLVTSLQIWLNGSQCACKATRR